MFGPESWVRQFDGSKFVGIDTYKDRKQTMLSRCKLEEIKVGGTDAN